MTTTREAWCVTCNGPVPANDDGCIACHEKRERDRLLRMNAPLRASCAICGGTYGLHKEQLESGGPVFTICANHDGEVAPPPRKASKYKLGPRGNSRNGAAYKYRPIDALERDMTFRILRGVGHFDLVASCDLAVAIGIELDGNGKNHSYNAQVSRLCRDGYLERVKREYRITDKGKAHLENEISRQFGPGDTHRNRRAA